MSYEEFQFIVLTGLTGFVTGFLTAFLGIKISKLLFIVGIVLLGVFYFFVNGSFDIDLISIQEIFMTKVDEYGDEITNIKELLVKNIPLTVGVFIGALYGLKKAL